MPKAQTEIVGLLFIVIFLSLAGLLYIRFSLKEDVSFSNPLRQSIAATHMLDALVHYNAQGVSFTYLASSCTPSSCEQLENLITSLLTSTLSKGTAYHFTLSTTETLLDIGTCTAGITSTRPFTSQGIFYETTLTLC